MSLSVDNKDPLTSLNNAKTNERNRKKYTDSSRPRLEMEPARNVLERLKDTLHCIEVQGFY